MKRLNFSRDMLAGLGKNLIFFTTGYGDEQLSRGAYDFYSFIKIKIIFPEHEMPMKQEPLDNSEKLLLRAEKIRKELFGEDHPQTGKAYYELACMYQKKGIYTNAEKFYKRALDIRKTVFGENHPDTAACWAGLAFVFGREGKYRDSEELYKRALAVYEIVPGEECRDLVKAYKGLCCIYNRQGRFKESEELCRRNIWERGTWIR